MAADNRPYKSKEQDGQGNEIIIRDQQLVEQASQTTMASGEDFEIVDVDGRMAKIPKDNMIGVVREALGTLLNGLADQTTVTKALTLNGNTLGASTAATLASVLGGVKYQRVQQGSSYKIGEVNTSKRGNIVFFSNSGVLLYGIIIITIDNNGDASANVFYKQGSKDIGTTKGQSNVYNSIYAENGNIYIQGVDGSGDCYYAIY
jgi:hypothetical protein